MPSNLVFEAIYWSWNIPGLVNIVVSVVETVELFYSILLLLRGGGGLGVGGELLTAGCVTLLIPGPLPTPVTEVWNKTVQPFQRKQLDSVDYIWLNYSNISFHWFLEYSSPRTPQPPWCFFELGSKGSDDWAVCQLRLSKGPTVSTLGSSTAPTRRHYPSR